MKLVATTAPLALLVCATFATAQPTKPEPAAAAKVAPDPKEERVVPPGATQGPPPAPATKESSRGSEQELVLDEENESDEELEQKAPPAPPAPADEHAKQSAKTPELQPARPIDITPQTPPPEPEPPEPSGFGDHQRHFTLGTGVRLNWLADEGYNQFSDKPLLGQFTLAGGYAFPLGGAFSVAAKVGWDFGGHSSTLRGLSTTLDVHRFTLGPSLRYHAHRRLFLSVGVMPGVRYSVASLKDSGVDYSGGQAAFAMDLLGGVEFQIFGKPRNDAGLPRWWVGLEGGYSIGTSSAVVLEPGEDAPARTQPLGLEPLELGGGLMRLTTSITY